MGLSEAGAFKDSGLFVVNYFLLRVHGSIIWCRLMRPEKKTLAIAGAGK
jgi:hypothetical protein